MSATLWLRAETKPGERRTPLTPEGAAGLVARGVRVVVEGSAARVCADADFAAAGCELVAAGSWSEAPVDAWILGLKDLPASDVPLRRRHIFFGHAYKGQRGGAELLGRFVAGGGQLYDLEYLVDERGRRVAAFGYWAGFVGATLGIGLLAHQRSGAKTHFACPGAFADRAAAVEWARERRAAIPEPPPRAIVIGALGRCGHGACDLLRAAGVEATAWDLDETRGGGPFREILSHDLFLNCVLMTQPTPPFLTGELLAEGRRLVAIADVACDPTSEVNPLPIYDAPTSMDAPALDLDHGDPPLALTAIDNLPSLLPKESSVDFAAQLGPHLEQLLTSDEQPPVWRRAREKFLAALLLVEGR